MPTVELDVAASSRAVDRLVCACSEGVTNGVKILTQRAGTVCSQKLGHSAFKLWYELLGKGQHLAPTLGWQHELGASIVWVGDTSDIPMRLKVLNELRHSLLGHLGPLGEEAHGCSSVVEVLEDGPVCGADRPVPPFRQSSNDEIVECYERLSHQDGQVCWTFSTFQPRYPT
jgi:hypothetical protein